MNGRTPLRMTELAETRAETFVRGGDGGLGVGLQIPGVLSHTSFHLLSLPLTSFHLLSLPLTSSHFLSLPLTSSHFLSLPLTSSHFLSLPLTSSHFLSLPLTSSRFLSLPFTSLFLVPACACPPALQKHSAAQHVACRPPNMQHAK